MKVSKVGLLAVFSFALLSLLGKFLFPFADEPDWSYRTAILLGKDHYFWSPYSIFSGWYNKFFIDHSVCQAKAGVTSLWAYIPYKCSEEIAQGLVRWLLLIFIMLPFFLIFTFKSSFIRVMRWYDSNINFKEWGQRVDALALTIIFPSVLYYLGVLAEEQLFLVVALYVFLFWGLWIPVFLLLMVLMSIDLGNFIVVSFFTVFLFSFLNFLNFSRNKVFIILIFLIFFSYFIGYKLLGFFNNLNFLGDEFISKSNSMYQSFDTSGLVNKYPIFLRPIITLMTFVFMTPSGVKVPILYIFFTFFVFVISLKVLKRKDTNLDCYWFIPIFSIIFLVFLFPTYANAKYYVFLMPFFVYVALSFYSRKRVFLFCFASSCIVLFHLVLYRI